MADQFKWVDFYTEFATELLKYKANRHSLIEQLKKVYSNIGMTFPKLETDIIPKDIDPFTIFGLFNKGITDANRINIISGIKMAFHINAEVPNDFSGIPVLDNRKGAFYAFEDDERRKDNDIDNLWEVFEAAIRFSENDSAEIRASFVSAYNSVMSQYGIRWNLTIGLYWIRPYSFINLDSRNREFLKDLNNISADVADEIRNLKSLPDAEKYLSICDRCNAAIRTGVFDYSSFPELSHTAWINSSVKKEKDEWWPSLSEYDPGLTANQYYNLFLNENVVKRSWLEALYEMYLMPEHLGTCKQLGDQYGYAPSHYISYLSAAAGNIAKETNCAVSLRNEESARYWPVIFQGKYTTDKSEGAYCWKMRQPVIEAIETLIDEGIFKEKENKVIAQFDRNMILYGPPGTGKTYYSVIYAVAVCESRSVEAVMKEPYSEILSRYNELQEAGRIAFTTFHQSYGYEEFIEGIKPKINVESETLVYNIEDGVFKDFCNRAKAVKVQTTQASKIKKQPRIWGMILGGSGMTDIKKHCFEDGEIRLGWSEVDDDDIDGDFTGDENVSWNGKHMVSDFKNVMEVGDVVVIEKNSKAIDAIGVITGEYEYDNTILRYPRKRSVDWLVKEIDQDMVQFLPNGRKQLARYSLYSFDYIGMDVISRILNEHTIAPTFEIEQETKPYVFIIDEINRGNISKIFGELITLIEDTKRAGAAEAMEAILPYSGEPFSVPDNVYILGTMNTADRSIALMDTALRRRFVYKEMMPDSEVLDSLDVGIIIIDGEELNVARMLDVINMRIEYLFDREHTIGHAFFIKLAEYPSIETLASIFEKNVIPLLQEYFYEDYEKIQLVLGDNAKDDEFKFVLDKPLKIKDIFNGNPDIDIPEKGYSIQHSAFKKLQSYKQIGKDL